MPHVIIKIATGHPEEVKAKLAEEITAVIIKTAGSTEAEISVGLEEVDPANWVEDVYNVEILPKWNTLYKKPGYDPFAGKK